MRKKVLFALFGATLLLSLTACKKQPPVEPSTDATEESSTQEEIKEDAFVESSETVYAKTVVSVYDEPDATSKLIGSFPIHAEISVTGKSSEWYSVDMNDKVGYISISQTTDEKPEEVKTDSSEQLSNTRTTTYVDNGDGDVEFEETETVEATTEVVTPRDVTYEFFDPENE